MEYIEQLVINEIIEQPLASLSSQQKDVVIQHSVLYLPHIGFCHIQGECGGNQENKQNKLHCLFSLLNFPLSYSK